MTTQQHAPRTVQGRPSAAFPGRGGPNKHPWYRSLWFLVIAGLVVGGGVGAAAAVVGVDPTASAEYRAVAAQRDAAQTELDTANTSLDSARGDLRETSTELEQVRARLDSVAGDLPERENRLKAALQKLNQEAAALDQRAAALDERAAVLSGKEKAVAAREKAVKVVETAVEDNTVAGEGVYEVGADIKAGTYKTAGRRGCYYAVLNSTDTSDIADNNNLDGPGALTVSTGQYLQLSGCAEWVWQSS